MAAVCLLASGAVTQKAVVGRSRRTCVSVRAAKLGDDVPTINKGRKLDARGRVDVDGSGKPNVFPTVPKAFLRSKTSEASANTGLGGFQGLLVVAAVVGVVALSSIPVLQSETGETLTKVAENYNGESLAAIAQRIQSSI